MKKLIIVIILLLAAGGAAAYFVVEKRDKTVYSTAMVKRGRIMQTVSETGTVKAADEIDLGFLNAGKIKKIYFQVGDTVSKGQILAELDYGHLVISRKEAMASLDVARENLNKLLAGATREEIAVAQAGVQQAKAAYEAAKNELAKTKKTTAESISQAEKTLNDLKYKTDNDITTYEQAVSAAEESLANTKAAYQKSIDDYRDNGLVAADNKLAEVNVALDTLNTTINDEDGKDLISVQEPEYLTLANNAYGEALQLLAAANSSMAAAKLSGSDTDAVSAVDDTLAVLNKTFLSLGYCFNALENSVTSSSFTQADLDVLKTNISAQQTTIASAVSAVQIAKQNLDSAILDYNTYVTAAESSLGEARAAYDNAVITAQNTLASAKVVAEQKITIAQSAVDTALEAWRVAQTKLDKIVAPANKHDILLAQARIKQAQASLDTVDNQIDNSIIKAPINGTITKVNYDAGEQVAVGKAVISMLKQGNFEIEVLISEADIAKVKRGDSVKITLDAFGDGVEFAGKVFFIEPAETVIQDVIYYKVKINFTNNAQITSHEIKPGMTANIIITTAVKDNVLIVPGRAIVDKDSRGKFIRLLVAGQPRERQITVGLRGDGGLVEVLSGVKEGDKVVIYIENKK